MLFSRSIASITFLAFITVVQLSISDITGSESAFADDSVQASKHAAESFRLMKAGEDDRALLEIDKAIKLGAGPRAIRNKVELLINLSRFKEALAEARTAEKLTPEDAVVHAMLGSILDTLNSTAEALDEFKIALAKNPNDRGFRSSRAKLYERLREFDKAASDLTVAINNTETQNRSKLLERRGNCYCALKDYPKAIADYTKALSKSYGRSELLRLRAAAYEKQGNHAAAKKDIQAASDMDEVFEPPSSLGGNK